MILHIETSSRLCSVALSSGDQVLADADSREVNDHSAALVPMIRDLLRSENLSLSQLRAVAVSIGPGSYTGLRVGLSTGKSICYALEIPLIAIDTLESLAQTTRVSLSAQSRNIYVAVLDARRMDAYIGVFGSDGRRIADDQFIKVASDCLDSFQTDGKDLVVCGETGKWQDFDGRRGFLVTPLECHARNLVHSATKAFRRGEFEDLSSCIPKYLKAPNITTSA